MPDQLQITCITMTERLGRHDRILRVGGATFNFAMHQAVVAAITGECSFFMRDSTNGSQLEVLVNSDSPGEPFLQASAGGIWRDNLLNLPQCVPPGILGVYAIDVR